LVLSTKTYQPAQALFAPPQDQVDVRRMLQSTQPSGYTPEQEAKALEQLAPALSKTAREALLGSPELALRVLDRLSTGSFAVSPAASDRVAQVTESLRQAALPQIAGLVSHPTRRVQLAALSFLAGREEPDARAAVLKALNSTYQELQQAALQALAGHTAMLDDPQLAAALVHLLKGPAPWSLRVKAIEALGAMPHAATRGTSAKPLVTTLEEMARHDEYALVRRAALQALHAVAGSAAVPTLTHAAQHDPEARVREAAQDLLREGSSTSPQ
jgi:HEAT repeat protein